MEGILRAVSGREQPHWNMPIDLLAPSSQRGTEDIEIEEEAWMTSIETVAMNWRQPAQIQSTLCGSRSLPVVRGISVIVMLLGAGLLSACGESVNSDPPAAVTGTAASRPSDAASAITGVMGGMKVRIPRHFVNLMEFSGEPTDWKRGPVRPEARPPDATRDIASFGFEVKYPSMEGLSSRALREDYDKRPFKVNVWMGVSITSGDIYRPAALQRMATEVRPPLSNSTYAVEPSDTPGLVRHVAQGVKSTGEAERFDFLNPDVYVAVDESGRATVVIHCHNTKVGREACREFFVLEPESRTFVSVYFGRDMLPQWEDIHRRTRNLLLGFRVD